MTTDEFDNPDCFRDFSCSAEFVGKKICYYNEIDSTNEEAKRNCNLPEGTVFVAKEQTSGRGRKGRTWVSSSGGLWMSILLKPDIKPEDVYKITLVIGLAVSKAIKGSMIKWPNDIVIGTKKVCGILTEMSTSDNKVNYVITGIGINVNNNEFPQDISEIATSIFQETGKTSSKIKLLSEICEGIEKYYKLFLEEGLFSIVDEYKKKCANLQKEVIINDGNNTFLAVATDIDRNGELLVVNENGVKRVISGEVSVRGLFGYV